MFGYYNKKKLEHLKQQYENKIEQFHEWLKGKQYGRLLEDHKTWVNYGSIKDTKNSNYDENKKQWELSRNLFIEECEHELKRLKLIDELTIVHENQQ